MVGELPTGLLTASLIADSHLGAAEHGAGSVPAIIAYWAAKGKRAYREIIRHHGQQGMGGGPAADMEPLTPSHLFIGEKDRIARPLRNRYRRMCMFP